jgi:hypothetical protein
MIGDLIGLLTRAGVELSVAELREVLWLGHRITVGEAKARAKLERGRRRPRTSDDAGKLDHSTEESESDSAKAERDSAEATDVEAESSRYFSPRASKRGHSATAVRLPGVRALPNASILTRSMRPLTSKRATWSEVLLDEEATVAAFAETGLFTPLYEAGRGKWFDLALVVEDSASMHLWHNVVGEFESLMRHLGAFRRVTRWSIGYRDNRLWLTSGARLTHASAELVNREGRQLVLLISDCSSSAWYGKAMFRFCDELGRVAPLAVLQMLPRRHWAATGLGAVEVGLRATFPGTPNRWLSVARPWWLRQESPAESVPMAVATLDPAELRAWTKLMIGTGHGSVKGVLLYAGDTPVASSTIGNSASARDRVNAFRAMVTADAFALAGVLALASPLTVPIMQLLHRTLFDGNDLVPLAEVFLGQLLKRAASVLNRLSFEEIVYDFDPEVRDLLLENVDRMQASVMLRTVGNYLAQTTGSATDIAALLADESGDLHIDEAARPFAEVVRRVRDRFDPARQSRDFREVVFSRGLISRPLPDRMQTALAKHSRPLEGKVLAISFRVSSELAELGYLSQHLDEAIIYLLRPLLRLGMDLLYGGLPPKRYPERSSTTPGPSAVRNMTLTLINLLNDERSAGEIINEAGGSVAPPRPSRLYIPSAWPVSDFVTPEDEAAWINTCSILRVLPKDAGLTGPIPDEKRELRRYVVFRAAVLSHMRQLLARGFKCPVSLELDREVRPAAFVFIGGKTTDFYGIMPGIMEEFLRAAQQRLPIFLVGGLGGAAGIIARALASNTNARIPAFTTAFYAKGQTPNYGKLLEGFRAIRGNKFSRPSETFTELWKIIQGGREDGGSKLLQNGLAPKDNHLLMTTTDTMLAVHLIWKGLSRLFLEAGAPAGMKNK